MPQPVEREGRKPDYRAYLAAFDRARATYESNPDAHALAILETGYQMLIQELQRPGKFELGQLVMTPGADSGMREARQSPIEFLLRHKHGDWGELSEEDVRENEWSLANGARLFSAYRTRTDENWKQQYCSIV
jgi:hypothetical protein